MIPFLLVGLGGAIGAMARYGCNLLLIQTDTGSFPAATLLVNALGSFLIGLGWTAIGQDSYRLLILVGVLGGFTTFSSFSLETIRLWQDGQTGLALWNILLNNITSIVMCLAGLGLGKTLHG